MDEVERSWVWIIIRIEEISDDYRTFPESYIAKRFFITGSVLESWTDMDSGHIPDCLLIPSTGNFQYYFITEYDARHPTTK